MPELPNPEPGTEKEPVPPQTPPQPSEPADPPQDPPAQDPPADSPAPPAQDPLQDPERKFQASTTENQILQDRLAREEAHRRELTKEPTEAELAAAIPGWEYMDEGQKATARFAYTADKRSRAIQANLEADAAERQWNTALALAIESNPALEGKEEEFRRYASKPAHRGASMELLVNSFLHLHAGGPAPIPTPKNGLETGSGGPRETVKSELSLEEIQSIRKNDPKRYRELVKQGKI